ncbi:hypothetical protein ACVWYN_002707 [Pedobacter sp. UYP24]
MIFVLPVSIKPFLRSYLAHYCEIEPHLTVSHKNRYTSFLINCLKHKTQIVAEDKKYTLGVRPLKLMLSIPEHYERNYGINIGIRQQYWFNQFLQEDFIHQMLTAVSPSLTGRKGELKAQLIKFRERYDISEDDLPFKTLEKMWERNKFRMPKYRMN